MKAPSALYRLLGDDARLRLLRLLSLERLNVTELTGILGIAQSGVSRHLGLLKEGGLVHEEREAGYTYYRVDPSVREGSNGYGPLWGLLASQFDGIANVHLDAVEYHDQKQGDQLVFMHAVKEGPANRSFGLQVAALAGLPKRVVDDARRYLATLESGHAGAPARDAAPTPQLGLFDAPRPSAAEDALRELDPDAMSPREALDALYRLKKLCP